MIWKRSKSDTRSSLQKCHSMHQPQNDQFFRWTLLAISLCKIMDTVRCPQHPAPRLLKEHYGQRTEVNLRGIRAKLEFSFANTTFTFFSHVIFKGVINKQAAASPQATTLPIPNFKFLFAFLRISQPFLCFVHRLFV